VGKVRQIFIWNGKDRHGPFRLGELVEELKSDAVLPSDYYYEEGMPDWERVARLPCCNKFLATDAQKQMLDRMGITYSEFLTKADVSSILENQPATKKQLDYLQSFGVTPSTPLTKVQASEMIQRCLDDPVAKERQAQFIAAEFERRRREREAFPSYYLKQDVLAAERALTDLKRIYEEKTNELAFDGRKLKELQGRLEKNDDEIERLELEQEIASTRENVESTEAEIKNRLTDLKEAKQELQYRRSLRTKFWKGTFSNAALDGDDLEDLADHLGTIDQLHAGYGRHLKVPTLTRTDDLLAALDNASPDWDKQQPKLFYSKYAASFPDAIKRPHTKQAVAKQGCLVLGLAIGSPLAVILIRIFC